jgi:hypothetical protein
MNDKGGHGPHLEPAPDRALPGAQLGATAHPGIAEEFRDIDEAEYTDVDAAEKAAKQARLKAQRPRR